MLLMEEVWKPVVGFEGYYEVSSLGRVRGLDRYVDNRLHNGKRLAHGTMKYIDISDNGRNVIQLSKCGKNYKFPLHRLIAMAFIPNERNLPQINHKDENPLNNSIENLEWCDAKYNCNYGTRNQRISESKYKPVVIFKDNSEPIEFDSQKSLAAYLNVCSSAITRALKDGYKCKGFTIKRKQK